MELTGRPGWTEVKPFPFGAARRTFTAEEPGSDRLSIRYFKREGGELVARVRFGPGSEGAPGHVHGGGLLTVLDEAMGAAAWIIGQQVMTVRLNAEFRRQVPVNTTLTVETEVQAIRGRMVMVTGRLIDEAGTRFVEGEGVFVRLTPSKLREVFGLEPSGEK